MSTVSNHLKKHPSARSSTIVFLQQRENKLKQLRQEIASAYADQIVSIHLQAVGIGRQVRERTDA